MKKKYIYIILFLLVLILSISGATFAYFMSNASSNEQVNASSKKFEVIYTGGEIIEGPLRITATRNEGLSTSVNIKMSENSVLAMGTIYINIEEMSAVLSNNGFKWEVYRNDDYTMPYSSGTFAGYNDGANNIIKIVDNYQIKYENTKFTIFFWLDGNNENIDNRVVGANFRCHIGANTENFTGVAAGN